MHANKNNRGHGPLLHGSFNQGLVVSMIILESTT